MQKIKLKNNCMPIRILLSLSVILFLTSCSFLNQNRIAGKWQIIDGEETIEFLNNGTVISKGNLGIGLNGKYKLIGNDKIEFKFDGLARLVGSQIIYYTLTGNQLIIELPMVGKTIFQKR